MGVLSGVTVVAVEQAIAAPFCTRQLADHGARVIKVERPGGGDFARGYDARVHGLSSQFLWTNRGKESLTLDLKQEEGQGVLARLLARADVFVVNLASAAQRRLGLDAGTLCCRHPELIHCSITGYGEDGPYRGRKAYDLLIQAEAGLLSVTGTPAEPVKAGISVADIAGGMYAFAGVLLALYRRRLSGEGAEVAVSLFDALAEWLGYPLYYSYGGSPPPRSGAHHATISPYGPFAAGDGEVVYLAVQNEAEWQRFCRDVLARPDLGTEPRYASNALRVTHRADLEAEIRGTLARMSGAELRQRLEAAGIAYARQNPVEALAEHPELLTRRRFQSVPTEVGEVPMLLPPIRLDREEPEARPVPALGADTDRILAELGYDGETVAALRARGVI